MAENITRAWAIFIKVDLFEGAELFYEALEHYLKWVPQNIFQAQLYGWMQYYLKAEYIFEATLIISLWWSLKGEGANKFYQVELLFCRGGREQLFIKVQMSKSLECPHWKN